MDSKAKKQLSLKRKLEIIQELEKNNPPSKRSLGRKHEVTEAAIRYIWKNKDVIKSRATNMSDKLQSSLTKSTHAKYPDLENKLYDWIEVIRKANLPISPTLVIYKAKKIAEEMSYNDFKASWMWFGRLKKRKGLQKIVLHGKRGEVDKNDPKVLALLQDLYDEMC